MDAVLEDATIYQRRKTLHKMTNGLGLDDAYTTTFCRIREQKGNKVKIGMEALMWISRSERPLKGQELCHALAVEVGTTDLNFHNVPSIRTLLGCTLGLVTIDEQTSTVRLIHFTLQEYLTAHPNLFMAPHSMMAEICLTYLNFRSVCELSTTLDSIPLATPFLHYASCYWGAHARKEITEGVKHLALRHLQRDANHISADILLREKTVGFLPRWHRRLGRHPNLRGFTGLHYISYIGIAEIAVDMVEMKRWDLNGRDSNNATPLIWAIKYGNCALSKVLLDQGGVDPTLADKEGLTPLTHAAKAGQEEVVKLLLERWNGNPDSLDCGGRTPLSWAAQSGHEGVVKTFLERADINPDSLDKDGRTPLSWAAQSGHELLVKILLEREDVNPNSPDESGLTPLSYAAKRGHDGVVGILLERNDVNPDSSDKDGRTPLSYAADYRHEGVVRILLGRKDVNPDSSDRDRRTPLSYAADYRHESVVRMLLERKDVNPNSSDKDGRTPLSYAVIFGHEGVVKILLERRDINPDSSDKHGLTPLSHAAIFGHKGLVRVLLERGNVNPNWLDNGGQTPLSHATNYGNRGVVRILLERGDVNLNSSDRDTQAQLLPSALARHNSVMNPSSELSPLGHEISPNIDITQQVSVPVVSATEEVDLGPIPQRGRIIFGLRHDVTEIISFPHSDKCPPNQLEAPPSTSALTPTLTPDTALNLALSQPSRPLKRPIDMLEF